MRLHRVKLIALPATSMDSGSKRPGRNGCLAALRQFSELSRPPRSLEPPNVLRSLQVESGVPGLFCTCASPRFQSAQFVHEYSFGAKSSIRAGCLSVNPPVGIWMARSWCGSRLGLPTQYFPAMDGDLSSRRSGVDSGSQVIAVVQSTQSWHGDDFARCI